MAIIWQLNYRIVLFNPLIIYYCIYTTHPADVLLLKPVNYAYLDLESVAI
jgi:hypothetical protein